MVVHRSSHSGFRSAISRRLFGDGQFIPPETLNVPRAFWEILTRDETYIRQHLGISGSTAEEWQRALNDGKVPDGFESLAAFVEKMTPGIERYRGETHRRHREAK